MRGKEVRRRRTSQTTRREKTRKELLKESKDKIIGAAGGVEASKHRE
jgi:hypothetical protein